MLQARTAVSGRPARPARDRKSTRLNSSHANISYGVFCLTKEMTLSMPCTFLLLFNRVRGRRLSEKCLNRRGKNAPVDVLSTVRPPRPEEHTPELQSRQCL